MASSVPAIGAFFFFLLLVAVATASWSASSAPAEAPSSAAAEAPSGDSADAPSSEDVTLSDDSDAPSGAPTVDEDVLMSVKELCNHTSHSDLCLTTLAPDGKTSEEGKVKDLAALAINKTNTMALEAAAYITRKDSNENPDPLKNCLRDCGNAYKTVVQKLTLAQEKIEKWSENSVDDANDLVSDSKELVGQCQKGCTDAIKKRNVLTKRNRDVVRLCSVVQSIFEMLDTQ